MSAASQRMVGILGMLVAGLLGFGAVQELVVRGIRGGETQPLIVGAIGALVSLLLGAAALAVWRQRPGARRIAVVAALAAIVLHAYAALPPHRNVGMLALLIAVCYAVILLVAALRAQGPTARRA
jgi:hypothetical protein